VAKTKEVRPVIATWYCTSFYQPIIEQVNVVSFTDLTVTYRSSWGRETRVNRRSGYYNYFPLFEEAVSDAISARQRNIDIQLKNISQLREDIDKLKAMEDTK